jgi:hypothetical protein
LEVEIPGAGLGEDLEEDLGKEAGPADKALAEPGLQRQVVERTGLEQCLVQARTGWRVEVVCYQLGEGETPVMEDLAGRTAWTEQGRSGLMVEVQYMAMVHEQL